MTQVMGIANKMNIYDEKIEDHRVGESVLRSLPNKLDFKFTTIEESKYLSTFVSKWVEGNKEERVWYEISRFVEVLA